MNREEAKFNSWLRSKIPGDFMRVENSCMLGVPDINVCWDGMEIWLESKLYYGKYNSPLLEPEQHAWGFRRTYNGGNVWVLAWDEELQLIHAYKHKLLVEPAATKYVRIIGCARQFNFNKHNINNAVWLTLFAN